MRNLIINPFRSSQSTIIILLLLFSCGYFAAQNYQITYEVKFKPITESNSFIKENMILKTVRGNSIFYNANKAKIDSLVSINDLKSIYSVESSLLRLKVFKNRRKDHSIVGSNFNQFDYWYQEDKINYYNLSKLDKYKGYEASEAFAKFGKREWQLIFTNDIPIIDGPYVFSNLPGLVIKATSLDGDYSFELIEIKKLDDQPVLKESKENIKKEKLVKIIHDFLKDPAIHQIKFKNDIGDSFTYEFSGSKSSGAYNTTNEQIEKIVQKFSNYPDKEVPILTF